MPFDRIVPHPLTAASVQIYAPAVSGVYGISNAQEWIYIGETDNIQAALMGHLQDWSAQVMKKHPTGFVCEVCDGLRRPARQDRLIVEYGPACNTPIDKAGSLRGTHEHVCKERTNAIRSHWLHPGYRISRLQF